MSDHAEMDPIRRHRDRLFPFTLNANSRADFVTRGCPGCEEIILKLLRVQLIKLIYTRNGRFCALGRYLVANRRAADRVALMDGIELGERERERKGGRGEGGREGGR